MPFIPGKSGNPKGDNGTKKKQKQIADMLAHLSPKLPQKLEKMLEQPEHMQFAVKTILERVYGKPPEYIEHAGGIELGTMSDLPPTAEEFAAQFAPKVETEVEPTDG